MKHENCPLMRIFAKWRCRNNVLKCPSLTLSKINRVKAFRRWFWHREGARYYILCISMSKLDNTIGGWRVKVCSVGSIHHLLDLTTAHIASYLGQLWCQGQHECRHQSWKRTFAKIEVSQSRRSPLLRAFSWLKAPTSTFMFIHFYNNMLIRH